MQEVNRKRDEKLWSDAVTSLELFLKKQVANRRAWGTFCKVTAAPQRPYTVNLEREGVTQQFFLKEQDVARFAATGSDLSLSTEIRTALQHLEKRTKRRSAERA